MSPTGRALRGKVTLRGVNSVWTLGHCTHVHMHTCNTHVCTCIHMVHTHNTVGAGKRGPPRRESLRPALQVSPGWTLQMHSQLCPRPSHAEFRILPSLAVTVGRFPWPDWAQSQCLHPYPCVSAHRGTQAHAHTQVHTSYLHTHQPTL